MAANVVPIEALNLPVLSDPKFVEYFRETKDQNFIIHFYNCFKNIDIGKFDKDMHENSKEMIKIIIHQRREFGERCLGAEDMKNKIEEKLIQLMKENIELNQKLAEEYVANNNLKAEVEAVTAKCSKVETEKSDAVELFKKENDLLSTVLQRTKKEKEALEKEIQKLQNGKCHSDPRMTKDGIKDGKQDQPGSMLRKHLTARKISQSAYITSTPLSTSGTTPSMNRRQSQTCIRQQQFCSQSSTSIFKRSTYTTSTTTASMNPPPQQLQQQPQPQNRVFTGFPTVQQTRQFMSCIQSQNITTSTASSGTTAATEVEPVTQIINVSAIPLPPPPTTPTWITTTNNINNNQFTHIPMDPFFSMPTMMPPTMPISILSPSQQQYYLP